MTNKALEDVLNESLYSGNKQAFGELEGSIGCGELLAFVGAGASSPIFPTWYTVLNHLNDLAKTQGLINEGDHSEIATQLERDPLEVASTLESAFTKEVFRVRLADIYRVKKDRCTSCHLSIVRLKIRGIITLNFDECLEHAYVQIHKKKADAFRAHDRSETVRWLQGRMFTEGSLPILHLHGTISDPEKMVFTSDDYNLFYKDESHLRLVKDLWGSKQMLAVGFGFTDPFLTRVAEQTLRDISSDARHYAFVGKHGTEPISPIKRKTFIRKYRLIPIFYQIRESIGRSDEDHSDLEVLLNALVARARGSEECLSQPARSVQPPIVDRSSASALLQAAERDFESQLFVAPTSGKVLYVEPKLVLPQEAGIFVDGALYAPALTDVGYVVESTDSYLISALPEHGLTLLCKRLVKEFRGKGVTAFLYDSDYLPNYKKKLLMEFPQATAGVTADTVLILDNFDIERHERLLNELIGLGYFSRFVICCQAKRGLETQGVDVDAFPIKLKLLTLSNLDRSDIRTLSSTLFDTSDADWVSGIVERVYEDLLELCIPLTPSNVVMYLTILYNEGDFRPLNRIQIVERYIY